MQARPSYFFYSKDPAGCYCCIFCAFRLCNRSPSKGPRAHAMTACDFVVLSDLHLSEGRDPSTLRVSRLENFFLDGPFQRMLCHLHDIAQNRGRRWILILNGDFMDFLRVTRIPDPSRLPAGLPPISPTKARYGLGTSPAESKWQLERIFEGHPEFFQGLARFLLCGHQLVILKGNHDVNWFWPEVRYRFLELLEDCMRRLERNGQSAGDDERIAQALDGVEIRPWVYYVPDLLYVEHGNQYDPVNAFRNFLYPMLLDPECPAGRYEIDLPFGSFFIRYFFNKIEAHDSTAANYVRPSSYFSTLLGRQFYVVWNVARNYLPSFTRTWRKTRQRRDGRYRDIESRNRRLVEETGEEYGKPEAFVRIAALHETPIAGGRSEFLSRMLSRPLRRLLITVAGLVGLSFVWSFLTEWILGSATSLLVRSTTSLVLNYAFIFAGILWFLFSLRPGPEAVLYRESDPRVLRAAAARISDILQVRYVTFGHSHMEDIWKVPGRHTWYFNTGTWTPVLDAENRIVRPALHMPVLLVENGQARLARWNDGCGRFEDLPVLKDPELT